MKKKLQFYIGLSLLKPNIPCSKLGYRCIKTTWIFKNDIHIIPLTTKQSIGASVYPNYNNAFRNKDFRLPQLKFIKFKEYFECHFATSCTSRSILISLKITRYTDLSIVHTIPILVMLISCTPTDG